MQPGALRALEFDRIVAVVRGLALTPTGAARLAELKPQTDPQRVSQLLAATTEGVRYLDRDGAFPLRAPQDLEAVLTALAIQGRPLEPLRLLALADYLESIENTRLAIRRVADAFPILRSLIETGSSFAREIADVRQKIEPSGDLSDGASPELRSLRDRLRKQRARLRNTLESFLRGRETAKYLQELIVTDRSGRYVLVVKAEHRTAIPGIVHGSSASGASLFLEPLSTVEINNDIVALEEQEAEEVRRILLALSDAFRARAIELYRTVELGTELDVVQAKARFSQLVGGVEPGSSLDGRLELRGARHPLLIGAVVSRLAVADPGHQRDAGAVPRGLDEGRAPRALSKVGGTEKVGAPEKDRQPVPVDLVMIPPLRVLLITGPNTGGKTVALKTAGLLALMAQAGLHVPAGEGSRLPVFRSVFADIGDEQSIAASLSTFSWHITNIASMDRALALPSLVLLDEIGAGTDPVEGGALGVAIVDHFRRRGVLVISTSHYDALKSYAATTEGVVCAAFGFDPETFAPNYDLTYGNPGRSLALEIARRLGLNPAIVDAAAGNVSDREAKLAEHLARMDTDMRELEHERRLVARERESLGAAEAQARACEDVLKQREEGLKRRFNEQLEAAERAAREEIDDIMEELRRRTAELAARAGRRLEEAVPTGETGAARSDARSALDAVVHRLREQGLGGPMAGTGAASGANPSGSPGEPERLAPRGTAHCAAVGDRVVIETLGMEGTVQGIADGHADLDVRGKRFRAPVSALRVLGGAARPAPGAPPPVHVHVELQPRDDVTGELNVIGCSVDEALARTEKFLDEMLLNDQRTVRVIHGYGTGQLRRAIAAFLERHPLVAKFDSAPPNQGGGGVTVVELKE